jgi:molecular chaperone GrpE
MHDEKRISDDTIGPDDEIELIFDADDDAAAAVESETEASGVTPASPETELQVEVDRLKDELEHLREMYLRKLAEFDNFRKRTDREREELNRVAGENLVRELIPALDNFERALQHASDTDPVAFRQGVEMIAKQLWETLQRQGLETLDPVGQPFQPEYHEAIQRVDDTEKEPGTVVWVLAKGYLFGGRLLRPAMVGVAVEPSRSSETSVSGGEAEGEGEDVS